MRLNNRGRIWFREDKTNKVMYHYEVWFLKGKTTGQLSVMDKDITYVKPLCYVEFQEDRDESFKDCKTESEVLEKVIEKLDSICL